MAFQGHIDWAWENNSPPNGPDAGRCSKAVILKVERGNRSAHDCVVECINEWVKNRDFKASIQWLTLGAQCHDKKAQNELNAVAGQAVRYAVTTYGPGMGLTTEQLAEEQLATL